MAAPALGQQQADTQLCFDWLQYATLLKDCALTETDLRQQHDSGRGQHANLQVRSQ